MNGNYKLDCPECEDKEKGLRPQGDELVCLDRGHRFPMPPENEGRLPATSTWTETDVTGVRTFITEVSDWGPQGPVHCPVCGVPVLRHLEAIRDAEDGLLSWRGNCGDVRLIVIND